MTEIVFFDFDSTLYSHFSHSVPKSVYEAISALKDKGIKTCLCTGRCSYELENYFDLSGLHFDYYIFFNGQAIFDREYNTLFSVTIEGIDKQNAVRIFKEKKVPIILESKDDYYVNYVDEQVYHTCVECSSSPVPRVHDYVEDDLYMSSIFPGKVDDADSFIAENFPNCYTQRWNDGAVDLLLKGHSKAEGIDKLLKMLNIDIKDTMAFGDAENDAEMMKKVEISVAMGNAEEHIKQISTYVTTHIDDDGIYNGLKHFNLI